MWATDLFDNEDQAVRIDLGQWHRSLEELQHGRFHGTLSQHVLFQT